MESLKKLCIESDINIVGLTEVNKDWRKVPNENTIWNGTAGWKENRRIQIFQNYHYPSKSEFLVGGTASIIFGEAVFRISDQGADKRNLGRWSYFTITGKNDLKTTFLTCYCPVRGKSTGAAYSQHLIYMANNKDHIPSHTTCPRQLFGIDLKELIHDKIDQGHQLIVQGDFNSEYLDLQNWMLDLGLKDLIHTRHGACPKTYNRSKNAPLDCIFGSAGMTISKGVFLPFGRLQGDHRGVWVDIPTELIFGYNPPPIVHHLARRLKMDDPRVVDRYLEYLHEAFIEHDLFQRMNVLHINTVFPLSVTMQKEYEVIDEIVTDLMDKAELQCRQLHTGNVTWSPTYKKVCLQLVYWLMRRTKLKGLHSNTRQLIVLQNKLDIPYDSTMNLDDIETKIIESHARRKKVKIMAESLSLEYRTRLALAKEEAGEIEAATFIRNMNALEDQRKLFRNIRHMEGKIKGGNTSKVVVTAPDGSIKEFVTKNEVEGVSAEENEAKMHQTEGGSQLLEDEFIADLGRFGEGPHSNNVLEGTYIPPITATAATADFLKACKKPPNYKPPPHQTPIIKRFNSIKHSWKLRKEKTCTYNQHIGHYKAIMKHDYLSWFFFSKGGNTEYIWIFSC